MDRHVYGQVWTDVHSHKYGQTYIAIMDRHVYTCMWTAYVCMCIMHVYRRTCIDMHMDRHVYI